MQQAYALDFLNTQALPIVIAVSTYGLYDVPIADSNYIQGLINTFKAKYPNAIEIMASYPKNSKGRDIFTVIMTQMGIEDIIAKAPQQPGV